MTPTDATRSSDYAVALTRLLWPDPWEVSAPERGRKPSGSTSLDWYVFPGPRCARMLVPAEVPGSSSMLHRLGSARSHGTRYLTAGLVRATRSPFFPLARWPKIRASDRSAGGGADSIETYLGQSLGAEVRAGIVLGTPRPNQKPVLQVFGSDGRLTAYAKIGHNDLTAPLVRREAQALALLARHPPASFRAPQVLHTGTWRGLEVLVISPLLGEPLADPSLWDCITPMGELARLHGTTRRPLQGSAFWARTLRQVQETGDPVLRQRLSTMSSELERRWGEQEIELGAWHGDWGPWNMAWDDGMAQVWDWERFDAEVPVGFDGLHYAAQEVRPEGRHVARQCDRFLRSSPGILASFDVPATAYSVTRALYFLEVSVRYAHALRRNATPVLQRRLEWCMQMVEHEIGSHRSAARSEEQQP